MSQTPRQTSSAAIPETTVTWLALAVAPVVYTVVAFTTRPGEFTVGWPDLREPIHVALTAGAIMSAVAGFVLPPLVARQWTARISGVPADDPRRAGAERLVMIIRGALFEVPAIAGFVMVMMGARASTALPFAALALALFLTHFPTREMLARPFEE